MSRLLNSKNVLAGLMFMAFGAGFFIVALNYTLGTAARMGPGYFPRVLGIILFVIGAFVLLEGLVETKDPKNQEEITWHWIPMLWVLGAVGIFGAALQPLGLVVASILLIAISGGAAHDRNWKEIGIVAIVMAIFCVLVFVKGLGLIMPIWPSFLGAK